MHQSLQSRGSRRRGLTSKLAAVFLLCSCGVASASGWPPFAFDDSATVKRGATTTVLDNGASSVLDNDFDLEGDKMLAFLASLPKHGTVVLRVDGTFSYTHNGNDKDKDDFEYVVFDGTNLSRRAKVRITIEPGDPVAPIVVGQDDISVNEDESIVIELDDLDVEDPDSDYPDDFTLTVADGQNYSRSGAMIRPAENFNGSLSVPVRVNDGGLDSQWFNLAVEVRPRNDRPFTVGAPPDQEAIENFAFSLALAQYFDDIDDGDSLRFSAQGLPASGSLRINASTGVLSGTPVQADALAGPYQVQIVATDSGGLSASLSFQLTVFPDDRVDLSLTVTQAVNPTTIVETTEWLIDIDNNGPADLDEGELRGDWVTSGSVLSLSAPPNCTIIENNTAAPSLSCALSSLPAGDTLRIVVQGSFDRDGDHTIIAVAIADDPIPQNNTASIGGNVVSEFSQGAFQLLDATGSDLAAADFDGDGWLDIAASGAETMIFRNSGQRRFAEPGASLGAASDGNVVVALDWNGDSTMDIAVAGSADRSMAVYANDGTGNFLESVSITDAGIGNVTDAVAADLNQDGFFELVVTGTADSAVVTNTGTGSYDIQLLGNGAGIATASDDLNQDGLGDIVVVSAANREINVLINNGNGTTFTQSNLSAGSVSRVSLADLNADGRADILLSTDGSDLTAPYNQILSQMEDGSFAAGERFGASAVHTALPGDIDLDGWVDIVAIGKAGVHQVYRGSQASGLALHSEQIVSDEMRRGLLQDFNNDGSLDLILAGGGANVVELHANNGIGGLGLGDLVAPDLTLIGDLEITLAAGTEFVEPGATATDDIEGDLTAQIETIGTVNSSAPGTYQITYTVADRAGNSAVAVRTVTVGVNTGTGGSGGGSLSPLAALFLACIALVFASTRTRRYNKERER